MCGGRIIIYPDLNFKTFTAVREEDAVRFLLFLGTRHQIEFEVDDASEWVTAIKEQCEKEEPKQQKRKKKKKKEEPKEPKQQQ